MDAENSSPNYNPIFIGSATPVDDVIHALATRGCPDLTSSIDLSKCSDLPFDGGGLCDVYKGATNHGTPVAIKSLRLYDRPGKENDKEKTLKRAARELYHWTKLRHPNVLPLMGLAMFRGRMSMVSEWMENGNLSSYIRRNPCVNRIRLCMDICAGLSYIHTNKMTHGDLKAANVMVSRDGAAMIADFGNSRLRDLTLRFTNTTGSGVTVRWAAPELLGEDNRYGARLSTKADVYSYGMIVLETLTGKVPYDGFNEGQVMIMVVLKQKTPDHPAEVVDTGLWAILQDCWLREPSERPDIASVQKRLLALYGITLGNAGAPNNARIDDTKASVGKLKLKTVLEVDHTNASDNVPKEAKGNHNAGGNGRDQAAGRYHLDQLSDAGWLDFEVPESNEASWPRTQFKKVYPKQPASQVRPSSLLTSLMNSNPGIASRSAHQHGSPQSLFAGRRRPTRRMLQPSPSAAAIPIAATVTVERLTDDARLSTSDKSGAIDVPKSGKLQNSFVLHQQGLPHEDLADKGSMITSELSKSLRRDLIWERTFNKFPINPGALDPGAHLTAETQPGTQVANDCRERGAGSRRRGRESSDRSLALAKKEMWANDYNHTGW